MVKALINISDETNQVLNIVKAKFGLRDKSEAINVMAMQYEEEILELQIRPEYLKKLDKIRKGKYMRYDNVDEMIKDIEKG